MTVNFHIYPLFCLYFYAQCTQPGAPDDSACFDKLAASRVTVAALLGVEASALELSMGMSGDYEAAIERGATSVRVGSTIFGARIYPQKDTA